MHKTCVERQVCGHTHHKGCNDEIMNTDNKDTECARSCFGRLEDVELDILKRKLMFEEQPSSFSSSCPPSLLPLSWDSNRHRSKRETEEKEER